MKDYKTDIQLITSFFELALSEEELLDFENRLLQDSEFVDMFRDYKTANNIVQGRFEDSNKDSKIQKWNALLDQKHSANTKKIIPWNWIGAIAAGLVICLSIYQFNTQPQHDMDTIIANAWNKNIGLDFNTMRSANKDSIKAQIIEAHKAYKAKDYNAAISQLSVYKTSTPYYEDVLLLRALSLYKSEKSDMALKTLDTLSKYPTGRKSQVAKWYQGLIYLDQGNIEAAKRFLTLPDNDMKELKLLD